MFCEFAPLLLIFFFSIIFQKCQKIPQNVLYCSPKFHFFKSYQRNLIIISSTFFRSIKLQRGEGRTSERDAHAAAAGRRPVQAARTDPSGADREGRGRGFRALLRCGHPGDHADLRF